ncbi:branched-chain amino acid transaminase [Candidatus Saccharibacteria bacterium]|nr:branched-chain amino acid transaminase [Candidatus Saccharibacteria bacterium]
MTQSSFLPVAYLNGKYIPFEEANVSIATHALHYGTAAFGGLRGWVDPKKPDQAVLFRLDKHVKRLANSGKYLQADFSAEQIQEAIIEFIKKNKPNKPFYIRPLLYISDLGISPRVHNAEKDLLIYGLPLDDYLSGDGVSVCFSSWTRQQDSSLPLRGKISGAYITSSLAKSEAINRGFDEALLLKSDGKVSEASGMNVFCIRDGQLITPGVEQDILEGITRASVIQVARDLDIPVVERALDKSELYIADEVFLCGTAAKIAPVKKVETTNLSKDNPITQQIKTQLDKISKGQHAKYQTWNTIVSYK